MLQFAKKGDYLIVNNLIKDIKLKFKKTFGKQYYIVYKHRNGKIKTYLVGDINLHNSFGNKNYDRDNIGFRAYCFGRNNVRSFRHDRIISLTKK